MDATEQPPSASDPENRSPCDAFKQLLSHCTFMLEAAVAKSEPRLVIRLLRHYKTLRACLNRHAASAVAVLKEQLQIYAIGATKCHVAQYACEHFPDPKELEKCTQEKESPRRYNVAPLWGMQDYMKDSNLFETRIMLNTLALVYYIDAQNYKVAMNLSRMLAELVFEKATRIMDYLGAKVYFYYSRAHELGGSFQECRSLLMSAYRKACIHHDYMSQAVTLNCLLRNLLHANLYSFAFKLISRTALPEYLSSNAQYARYHYYYGKILAVQLEYSEAFERLTQALQKAPQDAATAHGFKLAATKLSVIVSLLMGDIPYKSIFTNPSMRRELAHYEQLVLAVLNGDLGVFASVSERYASEFQRDGLTFLISRLRHNVIKSGLRKINLSYSKIYIGDVADKLGIGAADCESTIAKAIYDGIIEAEINKDKGYMYSKANVDLYKSDEPSKAFNKRIDFCVSLHSHAIQAMRFPEEPQIHKENKTEAPPTPHEILQLDDDSLNF
ncbi:bifunctional Proteasome component (PCI) domain/Winged helix DNA-binding domain superfamily/26S proteasome regulatory subunit [Babesia duncani]|uniref:Bifunctional Proteasome component (PCI) domain/Winged helix DNA-binding domain superfamily/26S proteasome regulatory subunit n=1 Tax=Babesia duncani TaxID=323732 RepID=A0AAD9UQY0_9APIC|nr:bifunctional Proteasome component (PCI) domain/Winged helix DNA-binding domain superfamily/26S proteasome regulatory subunit [Babesia duncani]